MTHQLQFMRTSSIYDAMEIMTQNIKPTTTSAAKSSIKDTNAYSISFVSKSIAIEHPPLLFSTKV